jgi:hypothetical protein
MVACSETIMKRNGLLKWWSAGVGAMDALTGLGLMFVPVWVLACLRIEAPSAEAIVFLRWIGAFVCAVGLSYGLALFGRKGWGEASWIMTSLARLMVALFLTVQMLRGELEPAWSVVALSDAAVAFVQLTVLWRGGWKEEGA